MQRISRRGRGPLVQNPHRHVAYPQAAVPEAATHNFDGRSRGDTIALMPGNDVSWPRLLVRGLRKRCPRCGEGRLFARWYTLHDRCASCRLDYDAANGDTWAFMYMSTAFLTGGIIVGMLLTTPPRVWTARLLVFPIALVVVVGSLPFRKGVAIAFEFFIEQRTRTAPDEDDERDPPATRQVNAGHKPREIEALRAAAPEPGPRHTDPL